MACGAWLYMAGHDIHGHVLLLVAILAASGSYS